MMAGLIATTAGGAELAHDYPIRPAPAHRVRFADAFWQPRLETNRTATIPYSFQMCEETGRIENFKVAGGLSDKRWEGGAGFNDSDVSKIIEGASYSLMTHPDAKLEAYLDQLIGYMAAAQEDDGYLYTAWTAFDTIAEPDKVGCRPRGEKWKSLVDSHELYNLGHMYEAAVAHYEATGKTTLLDVAKNSAELLLTTFGPGKIEIPPGHPEIELGLVKLYRTTGDARYLDLARFFLEIRGVASDDRPQLWGENLQDHKPLREQEEAVGHAVRAMYLFAGATDLAALTGDQTLGRTVDCLWENVIGNKLYLTGGIGSTGQGEAFGKNYQLPNQTAYAETCAAIALCYWAQRMFLLHGDAQYIDVLERSLYNCVLAGVSLDGREFFYPNPLASRGDYARSKWFGCACCPTNMCRFIPSVPGYAYAVGDEAVYVNLFVEGSADLALADRNVHVEQTTRYPWDGTVEIAVTPQVAGEKFALHVRIPGWASANPVPSDLYRYIQMRSADATMRLNGKSMIPSIEKGYATIDRAWQPGDTISLQLPMYVWRVFANERVEADRGRVALQRGPIVYCIEWPDVEGGKVGNLVLPDDAPLATEFRPDLLGGVQVVTGMAQRIDRPADDKTTATTPISFTAIPYYAWAHRGKGEMAVWLARTRDVAGRGADDRAK